MIRIVVLLAWIAGMAGLLWLFLTYGWPCALGFILGVVLSELGKLNDPTVRLPATLQEARRFRNAGGRAGWDREE